MSENSMERRRELIEQMRRNAGDNQSSSVTVRKPGTSYESEEPSESGEAPNFQLWKIKFFIGAAIFVGFLFLDATGTKFYKMNSDSIETMITNNIKTEEVSSFIQDKVSGFTDF